MNREEGGDEPPLTGGLLNWLWLAGPERWERALEVLGEADLEGALAAHFPQRQRIGLEEILSGAIPAIIKPGSFDLVIAHGSLDSWLLKGPGRSHPRAVSSVLRLGAVALRPGGCLAIAHSNPDWRREGSSAWRLAASTHRLPAQIVAAGFHSVRLYFAEPSLRRLHVIVPAERHLMEALRCSSEPGLRHLGKKLLCRTGLGRTLYPVTLCLARR